MILPCYENWKMLSIIDSRSFSAKFEFPEKKYMKKKIFAFNAFVTLGFMIYLSKGNKYLELHDAYCESDIWIIACCLLDICDKEN